MAVAIGEPEPQSLGVPVNLNFVDQLVSGSLGDAASIIGFQPLIAACNPQSIFLDSSTAGTSFPPVNCH
jgi:hypothetical protein